MKQNKFNTNLILSLVFSVAVLTACNGTVNSSSNQLTSATIPTLSGLAYDPVTKAVFSVNSQGALCQLPVKNIPGNLECNIVAPDNILCKPNCLSHCRVAPKVFCLLVLLLITAEQ